jgi:molecular chaperone GrpE (heat shock protein)
VLPTKTALTHNYAQHDDETKAAISDITTTAKTESDNAKQELEKAKELIESQRREIQELRDQQQKSNASYENVLANMNE